MTETIVTSGALQMTFVQPPPAGTVLKNAADLMVSGEWKQMIGANLPSGLNLFVNTGGNSGGIIAYTDKFVRDTFNASARKFHFSGCDHGGNPTTAATKYLVYDENTNTWAPGSTTPPWSFSGSTPQHQYENSMFDSLRGKYWFKNGAGGFWRYDGNNSWVQAWTTGSGNPAGIGSSCYFPELDKLMYFDIEGVPNGVLIGTNPVTGARTTYASGATLSGTANYQQMCLYSALRQMLYFGGGSGGSNKIWTCSAAGVVTAKDSPPFTWNIGGGIAFGGATCSFINPTNGNLVVLVGGSVWYEFDPTRSTGQQWQTKGGTPGILASQTWDGSAYGIMSAQTEYGVVAFVKFYSASQNAQMWLWKP